jgi:hypothetical protein
VVILGETAVEALVKEITSDAASEIITYTGEQIGDYFSQLAEDEATLRDMGDVQELQLGESDNTEVSQQDLQDAANSIVGNDQVVVTAEEADEDFDASIETDNTCVDNSDDVSIDSSDNGSDSSSSSGSDSSSSSGSDSSSSSGSDSSSSSTGSGGDCIDLPEYHHSGCDRMPDPDGDNGGTDGNEGSFIAANAGYHSGQGVPKVTPVPGDCGNEGGMNLGVAIGRGKRSSGGDNSQSGTCGNEGRPLMMNGGGPGDPDPEYRWNPKALGSAGLGTMAR